MIFQGPFQPNTHRVLQLPQNTKLTARWKAITVFHFAPHTCKRHDTSGWDTTVTLLKTLLIRSHQQAHRIAGHFQTQKTPQQMSAENSCIQAVCIYHHEEQ